MTNDQKLLHLVNETKELLDLLDKADETGQSWVYVEKAKKKRKELRLFVINNRIVIPVKPISKKYTPGQFNTGSAHYRNLAR